jgi:hypothetical protein
MWMLRSWKKPARSRGCTMCPLPEVEGPSSGPLLPGMCLVSWEVHALGVSVGCWLENEEASTPCHRQNAPYRCVLVGAACYSEPR